MSGGTSFANWLACVAVFDGCGRGAEALVERPTYEPLVEDPEALGFRVRRFDRRFADGYAIDLDRFASRISPRTRLAIVTNLHNPSGARIDLPTLRKMARLVAKVDGVLLVDEVYLECVFRDHAESSVHAGPNVLTTNSLTKAYGLDGLRAGWILGSRSLVERAGLVNDLMTNNGVAPGERMALAAFDAITGHRSPRARHPRSESGVACGSSSAGSGDSRRTCRKVETSCFRGCLRPSTAIVSPNRLLRRYSTLVVPGRFFETPRHIRISFGCPRPLLERGLANISSALTQEMRAPER